MNADERRFIVTRIYSDWMDCSDFSNSDYSDWMDCSDFLFSLRFI